MKINFLLIGILTALINNPLYACDIVNKKSTKIGDSKGVAGNCSNSGEKIECHESGELNGGFTCDGPEGTLSGSNLKNLIYTSCGCTAGDQENIERQLNQELK